MSKTRGNAWTTGRRVERYGSDALRYYLLREVAFGPDGGSATTACTSATTAIWPTSSATSSRAASRWSTATATARCRRCRRRRDRGALDEVAAGVRPALRRLDFTGALERGWELVRALNRYVEERAPWQLAQRRGRRGALDEALATLAEGVRVLGVLLWPFLPGARAAASWRPWASPRTRRVRARRVGSGSGRSARRHLARPALPAGGHAPAA